MEQIVWTFIRKDWDWGKDEKCIFHSIGVAEDQPSMLYWLLQWVLIPSGLILLGCLQWAHSSAMGPFS